MESLYNFQVQALSFLIEKKRALLALDCGLGKTRVCIELAKELKKALNIVCPAYLKSNWEAEIEKWKYPYGYVVASYEGSMKSKYRQGILVLDEAHYLRNWTAARTKNCIKHLAPQFKRVVLSTATPLINSASDLHPLVSICEPGKWGKHKDFVNEYCIKIPDNFKPDGFRYVGVRREEKLFTKMRPFTFIRSKGEVLKELPEKIMQDIILETRASERSHPLIMGEVVLGKLTEEIKSERRRVGLLKLPAVSEFIESVNLEKHSVVVFAWHQDVIEALAKKFEAPFVHGGIPANQRSKLIYEFQSKKFPLLIASIGACGVGVNLHAADIAVFAEIPWTAAELKQCEDRLHRIGQQSSVHIYRFLAKGTIDEAIKKSVDMKSDASSKIGVEL